MFGRRGTGGRAKASEKKSAGASSGSWRKAASRERTDRGGLLARRATAKNAKIPRATRQEKAASGKGPSLDWGRLRLWTVGIVFSLLWVVLWGRAYYLQIIMGPEYAAMAKRQHTAREVVRGVRGNILDRNGNVIARSVECASVWANPSNIRNKQETAVKLAAVLNKPVGRVLELLKDGKRFVWLQRKVDYHTAEKVRGLSLPGVYLDTEYERVYPYKHLAGQLLGFVNIDDKGIEGLEKSFDHDLIGRSVTQVVERDASGRRLMAQRGGSLVDLRGRDVRLTIDTQVQFFAEEALAENVSRFEARWGGCIVVDVPTGDILAWAQYPFFDPNNIQATPAADRRNRLSMDALEQGSTIKSFLIAAALEEQVVKTSTPVNCQKGKWKLNRFTLHDTHPYATLTVDKILHVSSNIGAAKIGLMLGAEKYRDYLFRLGFGKPTGLPLASEARGILRGAGKWAEIDLATASFGQSFSATLAQMAQAYLCLAGGGVQKSLRLVMDDSEECRVGVPPMATGPVRGERIFSPRTMEDVRGMLREVVEEEGGTGKHARIPGMVVGGKTGTAQKADASGKYGKGRVGSFVGMIPIEQPRYLICVLLDEPAKNQYGGVNAAPVFRHVALHTMAYHGLLPDTDDPLVRAVAQKEAERKAVKAGAKKPRAEAAKVASGAGNPQVRAAAAPAVPVASAVPVVSAPQRNKAVATAPGTVPTVVGMGIRSAVEVFADQGIVPVIKGKGGFVVRQAPEAGSPWPENKKDCTLWLEERAS